MKQLLFIISLFACITTSSAQKPEKAKSEKTQCTATTKKGTRCKLEVLEGKKYCSVHIGDDPSVAKCKATTKKGTRCKRAAVKGGYCTQHYKMKKK